MRFEVRNPTGAPHEVELEGRLATLGRDPTCDLVLNDPKCSRRHAVIEAGPDGLTIRDSGSANGIYVNGKKTERSPLVEGDVVRLGDASITVLGEDVPGTLVMGPEDIDDHLVARDPSETRPDGSPALPVPSAARSVRPVVPAAGPAEMTIRPEETIRPEDPAAPAPAPAFAPVPRPAPGLTRPTPAASVPPPHAPPHAPPIPRTSTVERPRPIEAARAAERPFTMAVLAMLWSLSVIAFPAAGFLLARSLTGSRGAAALGVGLFMAVVSGAMAWAIWTRASWARMTQVAIAGLGTLACFHPFSIASAVVLVYMLRPPAKHYFDPAPSAASVPVDATMETIVAGALLAAVVLGVLVTGALTFFARSAHSWGPAG